jgi:hypothetical protein
MRWRRSAWRDNERWQARLEADHRSLTDRLSKDQVQALDQLVVQFDEEKELRLSFVVVFGSQARDEADDGSFRSLLIWLDEQEGARGLM